MSRTRQAIYTCIYLRIPSTQPTRFIQGNGTVIYEVHLIQHGRFKNCQRNTAVFKVHIFGAVDVSIFGSLL